MKGHTRVNNIYLQSTSAMIDFLNSRWNSEPSNLNFGQRPTKGGKWVWKPIRFCWKRQGFKWHFCFTKNRWNHKVRMDTTWSWQKKYSESVKEGSSVSMGGDANRAVSQPDSQAPPPDESVGPIAGGVQPHYLLGHQHFGVTLLANSC